MADEDTVHRINLRISDDQYQRLITEYPEALSDTEMFRMALEQGLRVRETALRQKDIREATEHIADQIDKLRRQLADD